MEMQLVKQMLKRFKGLVLLSVLTVMCPSSDYTSQSGFSSSIRSTNENGIGLDLPMLKNVACASWH